MKITDVRTLVVNAEMRNWVFVKVETDIPGLYGWGEATLEWKTRAVVGAVEDLKPLVIGRDPRDIEQAVRIMTKQSFWRLGVIGMSAVSGIEIALWDILGKHLGVPVWRLLGGKVRDKVGVYTHLGLGDMRAVYESMAVTPLVERAREVVELATGPSRRYLSPIRISMRRCPRSTRYSGSWKRSGRRSAKTSKSWWISMAVRLRPARH